MILRVSEIWSEKDRKYRERRKQIHNKIILS